MENMTVERLIGLRHKAEALARRQVSLVYTYREVAPYYDALDDTVVHVLNPVLLRVGYKPKAKCPKYLAEYLQGRYVDNGIDGNHSYSQKTLENQAYNLVTVAILRKWGFNGYIQDRLPF